MDQSIARQFLAELKREADQLDIELEAMVPKRQRREQLGALMKQVEVFVDEPRPQREAGSGPSPAPLVFFSSSASYVSRPDVPDLIRAVLSEAGKPLSPAEVFHRVCAKGWKPSGERAGRENIRGFLMRRKDFRKTPDGRYGLRGWMVDWAAEDATEDAMHS